MHIQELTYPLKDIKAPNRGFMHVKNSYAPRFNKFANVQCFYCMTLGHASNVCYYRKLHLQLFPLDYHETNQLRPFKVWVQKNS